MLDNECVNVLDEDEDNRNIFFWTVIRQCIKELDILMRHHHMEINWSHVDNTGKTLLHYAVISSNYTIVALLLKYCVKYNINVDIPDRKDKITYVIYHLYIFKFKT